jgi:putative transcriptional regulator
MKSRSPRNLTVVLVLALALGFAVEPARAAQTQKLPDTYFLVAQPDLPDPLFQQSVILMLPPTGTPLVVGVIVNKPTTMKLGELFPHISALKNRTDKAYFGGPVDVSTPMVAFHAGHASSQCTALFKDVYITMESDEIMSLLRGDHTAKDMRVYLGRAQWTKDQLHDEMLENSWYTVPSDPGMVFSADPAKIWDTLVQQAQLIKTFASRRRVPQPLPELLPIAWPSRPIDGMISPTTGVGLPDFR